jgi:putative ABC transport system ATP-binding protein
MALIELRNVTKSYIKGDQVVTPLANLNLSVEPGDFVALMGPSGSGKTTLLNLVAGIDQPTAGAVFVNGTDISTLSRSKLARWRAYNVGYIFQLYHLVPVLTAYENVELPLLLHKLSRRERQQRVNVALEAVGLLDRHDHYPRQLSGGQEQRVAIARALVTDPAIIVADEPTGDLDRTSADATLALLTRLNQELGKTLVMVTHDPHAASVARRLVHLDKGLIVDDTTSTDSEPGDAPIVVPDLHGPAEPAQPQPARTVPAAIHRQSFAPHPAAVELPPVIAFSPRKRGNGGWKWAAAMFCVALLAFGGWKYKHPAAATTEENGVQIARLQVRNGYHPEQLNVQVGKPVLLKITKDDEDHCSDVFEMPDFKVRRELKPFTTSEISFTPTQSGTFGFRCGMDMMHGTLVVSDASSTGKAVK